MKQVKVYFKENLTTNEVEYDDEDRPSYYSVSKNFLKSEMFDHANIEQAFAKEDGDGDDSGSWSRQIKLITFPEVKQQELILYDPSSISADLHRSHPGNWKVINQQFDDIKDRIIGRIKHGAFDCLMEDDD